MEGLAVSFLETMFSRNAVEVALSERGGETVMLEVPSGIRFPQRSVERGEEVNVKQRQECIDLFLKPREIAEWLRSVLHKLARVLDLQ